MTVWGVMHGPLGWARDTIAARRILTRSIVLGSRPYRSHVSAAAAALLRRKAALAALAAFLLTGLAVLDDYGVAFNEVPERFRGGLTIDYVLGRDAALSDFQDRAYGVAFELPLALAERAFGIEDSRGVYLTRHLLTHLFHLAGGLFAYLLARRLFGSAALALAALLLFLVHPRIYADSFFNSKDAPFASMFMAALFLTHRAFARNTLWAFALLGAAVGLLTNIRIMGAMLVPAVLAMRGFDVVFAANVGERKRILVSAGAFAAAAALALYAAWPYLWADPIGRFAESFAYMARHPYDPVRLFRGGEFIAQNLPADYILTWFSITTPPFALALGGVGAAALLLRGASRPRRALADGRLRFGLLLIGCFALPVATVILLDSSVYGWRHMLFLYAPFSLLAVFGLRALLSAFAQARLRAAVYAAAGAGFAAAIASMALLHPLQHASFNFLVDRTTPERLKTQYSMHLDGVWGYAGLETLLRLRPSGTAALQHHSGVALDREALPKADRERTLIVNEALAEFALTRSRPGPDEKTLRTWSVYDNTIAYLVEKTPGANPYPAAREAAVSTEPVARSEHDVYLDREARSLTYVKEPCAVSPVDGLFHLLIYPERTSDLPDAERALGRANVSFHFIERGAVFDGKCAAVVPLPDYPIASIRTGQARIFEREAPWEARFPFAEPGARIAAYERAMAREPDVRAPFDLRLDEERRTLTYAREQCAPSDLPHPFFLHVTPEDADDLPEERRALGFESLGFDFRLRGLTFDGKCAAQVALPEYPIAGLRTGQWIRGEGEIWEAEVPFGGEGRAR